MKTAISEDEFEMSTENRGEHYRKLQKHGNDMLDHHIQASVSHCLRGNYQKMEMSNNGGHDN